MGIGADREAPCLLDELLDRRRLGLAVIEGGRRHRRQVEDVGHLVARRVGAGGEIEHGRDQDDAVEGNVVIGALELVEDGGAAGGAVAFAAEIFGRVPAAIVVEPQPDELGDRLGVLGHAPIIGRIGVAEGVAEAGADGIDEDDVGDVEQAVGIVDDRIGRTAVVGGVGGDRHPARAEGAHVQPDRARAGTAVEQEGDRPVGVARLADIGGREDRGPRGAVLGAQEGLARGRGVGDALAAEGARMVGDRHDRRAVGRRALRLRGGRRFLGGDGAGEADRKDKGGKQGKALAIQDKLPG